MPTWIVLRDDVRNKRFDVDLVEGNPNWKFAPQHGQIVVNQFTALGAGTNKMAVRVNDTNWVLLFGKTGGQVEKNTFKEEVDTLFALGERGVRVPKPFDAGVQANFIFDITVWNDGNEPTVPAFFQQYLQPGQYVEMPKNSSQARDSFVRDKVIINRMTLPQTIEATVSDLKKIQTVMENHPWGDFQVMYERNTGHMIVFDPLRQDPNAKQYKKSISTWLRDIDDVKARLVHLSRIEKLKAQNVLRNRRHSI